MKSQQKINSNHIFIIDGLDCPDCAKSLEKNVNSLDYVRSAKIDFMKSTLSVESDDKHNGAIITAIKKFGYKSELSEKEKSKTVTLFIPDMCCADEERPIRGALESLDGVQEVKSNIIDRKITIISNLTSSPLIEAIDKQGFKAEIIETDTPKSTNKSGNSLVTVAISSILILIGGILEYFGTSQFLYKPIIIIGIGIGGWKIGYKGFIALKKLRLDMNFLMSAAVIGAIVINEWVEAGVVIALFAIAQLLEAKSLDRARKAIESLINLAPKVALVRRNGVEIKVPVDEIDIGEIVIVRPGEVIPVDGLIKFGKSYVNQAAITGESVPVSLAIDDSVYAGTLNTDGSLEIESMSLYENNTLSKIIKMVEEAQSGRAPIQNFVDKFSLIYTPAVVGLAMLIAVLPPLLWNGGWIEWIYRSLTLLVIACPCALVISTPVTVVSALTAGARNGVLFKGGAYLEIFHKVKAIAFDKTGTLTKGKPVVTHIYSLNDFSTNDILRYAASIESRSEHPLAAAIVDYSKKLGVALETPVDFGSIPGSGTKGVIDGDEVYVGGHHLFEELDICDGTGHVFLEKVEDQTQTAVMVSVGRNIVGVIAIADEVRSDAVIALSELKNIVDVKTAMLTGDNKQTANAIGSEVNIDEIHAELSPGEKVSIIQNLKSKYGIVAMIGDGVNDAPALAAADIGIAMGAAGSDIALQTADIALMSDDLSKLPWIYKLSKKSYGLITGNIILAIGIKAGFVVLASAGLATLWMAVFADMGVSLMVILNGMRALKVK